MKAHRIYLLVSLALMAVFSTSPVLAAQVTASSQASIVWDSITFSSAVNWIDPFAGDTRGSFSSVAAGLNGPADPYGPVDYIDGAPWGNTSASLTPPLTAPNGSVSGSASTSVPALPTLTQQSASGNLALTGVGSARIDVAQAVLSGQFTVASPTVLTITANYQLLMALFSDLFAITVSYADASVGLRLANALDDSLFTSDERFFSLLLNGNGSDSFSQNGSLLLSWNLQPGILYDFESQASVAMNATAEPVPEPATMLLLGSGILGLAKFRKKIFG